jgi:hypothetical protein
MNIENRELEYCSDYHITKDDFYNIEVDKNLEITDGKLQTSLSMESAEEKLDYLNRNSFELPTEWNCQNLGSLACIHATYRMVSFLHPIFDMKTEEKYSYEDLENFLFLINQKGLNSLVETGKSYRDEMTSGENFESFFRNRGTKVNIKGKVSKEEMSQIKEIVLKRVS